MFCHLNKTIIAQFLKGVCNVPTGAIGINTMLPKVVFFFQFLKTPPNSLVSIHDMRKELSSKTWVIYKGAVGGWKKFY